MEREKVGRAFDHNARLAPVKEKESQEDCIGRFQTAAQS